MLPNDRLVRTTTLAVPACGVILVCTAIRCRLTHAAYTPRTRSHARASFRTLRCTRIDFADADAEREALAAIEPLCKHVADNEPGTLS